MIDCDSRLKWLEHRDKLTNKLESIYLLDSYGKKLIIKYEIKFQYSEDEGKKDEIECYIVTLSVGNDLPHHGVYEEMFEGYYYGSEKLLRVLFDLDKAKEFAEAKYNSYR